MSIFLQKGSGRKRRVTLKRRRLPGCRFGTAMEDDSIMSKCSHGLRGMTGIREFASHALETLCVICEEPSEGLRFENVYFASARTTNGECVPPCSSAIRVRSTCKSGGYCTRGTWGFQFVPLPHTYCLLYCRLDHYFRLFSCGRTGVMLP